jgi:hypothetical protein
MAKNVTVGASRVNGLGVFAAVRFPAGSVVLAIDDSHVVDADHPVPPGEEHHCDYLEQGKTVWMQAPERYINHSCNPNVYVRTLNGVRQVVALRAIDPREEIAYDYCINGYGDTIWTCHCGAACCRHSIHSDFFHLPLELQKEYLPLLDEWFVKEYASQVTELRRRADKP